MTSRRRDGGRAHRTAGRRAMVLVGAAGVVTPGVALGLAAHRSYADVRYSTYVVGLMVTVHAAVWLVLAALTWRAVGGRFVEVFSLGSWLALGAAVIAVGAMDHPYVYLAAYAVVAAAMTAGHAGARRLLARRTSVGRG